MPGPLKHSPGKVVKYLLIQAGIGVDPDVLPLLPGAWPVYDHVEPSSPDQCVTVYDTEGREAGGRHQISGERQDTPGIQVRVRSPDKDSGTAQAELIRVTLDAQFNVAVTVPDPAPSLGTTSYSVWSITRVGNVVDLSKYNPNAMLSLFTINAVLSLRQTS